MAAGNDSEAMPAFKNRLEFFFWQHTDHVLITEYKTDWQRETLDVFQRQRPDDDVFHAATDGLSVGAHCITGNMRRKRSSVK